MAAELKTKKNNANVEQFLNSVDHPKRREDSFVVLKLLQKITGSHMRRSLAGWGSTKPENPASTSTSWKTLIWRCWRN